ncbi:lipocalin family protein [Brevundimonas sp. VNH65]|uniref:lipocalin family protein n=1 Tax=Brevundimonas sp. VNH65 TaxID=3400917 RepID=UPI003C116B7A
MSRHAFLPVAIMSALALCACVTAPSPREYRAPAPTRSVDAARLYDGLWLEIGRTPMRLTDGCVAGTTTYRLAGETAMRLRDTCRADSARGKEKALTASAEILDPGVNTRFRARYLWGLVTWEYWILDHADDYSWFISSDPKFEKLWIYTRTAPDQAELDRLKARVTALGYDVSRLEFPEPLAASDVAGTAAKLD